MVSSHLNGGPLLGSQHGVCSLYQTQRYKLIWLGYAIASAAGFLFFGLNFGEEAGAATEVWVTRACVVQGLQQIWGESAGPEYVDAANNSSVRAMVLGIYA